MNNHALLTVLDIDKIAGISTNFVDCGIELTIIFYDLSTERYTLPENKENLLKINSFINDYFMSKDSEY